jgi:transcriptional regulator with XRE-family HTH domain
MEKSIYTREYRTVLRLLRDARRKARITQIVLAKRLGITQSQLSKIERGDRRLDIIELRLFCRRIGITLPEFVSRLEQELSKGGRNADG